MSTLISVKYGNNREGLVDDVTLNELIQVGRFRQFYRLSKGRWVDIENDLPLKIVPHSELEYRY